MEDIEEQNILFCHPKQHQLLFGAKLQSPQQNLAQVKVEDLEVKMHIQKVRFAWDQAKRLLLADQRFL